MKRDIDVGNWKFISAEKPLDGQVVILFLQDGRIIRVRWNQAADDCAVSMGFPDKGCYPLYWCDAKLFEPCVQ